MMQLSDKNIMKTKKLMIGIFAAYVLIRILRETMFFYENETMLRLFNYIKLGLLGLAAGKLFLDFLCHRLELKKILIMGIGGAFLCIVAYFTGVEELLIFWVLISATHDVNHRELCRAAGGVMLVVVAIAFLCSRAGIIENTQIERWYMDNHHFREGCGFYKPHTTAHYCFFGAAAWLYSRSKKVSWPEILLVSGLQVVIHLFAKTKNPFVIGMFCTLLFVLNKYNAFDRMAGFFSKKKALPWLGAAVIPICAVVPFILTCNFSWDDPNFVWLNNALSTRLSLGLNALQTFGFSWLGQNIIWSSEEGYNIVDSSFINIYVNYGVIFFALILFTYARMGWHAGKRRDIAFLIALLAVGMHSMFDCFLLMLYCNPFLMPFSYLGDNPPAVFKDIEEPAVSL